MTIPVWPTGLPQETMLYGYSEQYPDNTLRSESDAGVSKVRPKGATPPITFTRDVRLTTEQRGILKTFVYDTLKSGTLRFSFTHPVDGGEIELRMLPQGDSMYTISRYGTTFKTSLKFEILP